MKINHVTQGIRAFNGLAFIAALMTAFAAAQTNANATPALTLGCEEVVATDGNYPPLPATDGDTPDVSGEAGVVLYLQRDRALVEIDGCLYQLDRPLLIDVDPFDTVTLLVVLLEPEDANRVFVSEFGEWTETLESPGSFSYTLPRGHEVGFEIAGPTQPIPTVPVVIARPKPEPKPQPK